MAVMNQRLYLLNQLRKQGLDIRDLTNICWSSGSALSMCYACHCWSDLSGGPR